MHVTHGSGGNVQANVNIDKGAGFVDILGFEVNLRVNTVNMSSNLIVV